MIPNDSVLQRMTDAQLYALWDRLPKYPTNQEWVRLAKELRYREKFKNSTIRNR